VRITYLLTSLGMGGTPFAVLTQAEALVASHEVTIISVLNDAGGSFFPHDPRIAIRELIGRSGAERELLETGAPVPAGTVGAPPRLIERSDGHFDRLGELELIRVLPELETDVLVTTSPPLLGVAASLVRPGTRLVHQEHRASEFRSGSAVVLHRHLRHADLLTVLAEESRAFFLGELGTDCPWVEVVPNALPGGIRPLSTLDQRTIVAAGRLVPLKRFDLLIRAFERFLARHPGWRLRICGDGVERASLERLVAARGLENDVEFPGPRSDMDEQWAGASIAAMTSQFEGFPLVLVEAMAAGVPVVAFDAPNGPAEIVTDGVDGFLVEDGDLDAFVEALGRLADNATRQRMGQQALEVRDRLSPERLGRRWDELFRRLVTSVPSASEPPLPSAAPRRDRRQLPLGFVRHRGWVADVDAMTPSAAAARNAQLVVDALSSSEITYFHVPQLDRAGATVGIDVADRERFVASLRRRAAGQPVHLTVYGAGETSRVRVLLDDLSDEVAEDATVLRVTRASLWPGHTLLLGQELGCDVELWIPGASGELRGPRHTSVSTDLVPSAVAEVSSAPGALVAGPTLEAFRVSPSDRVTFPVDAVYLWVDGDDPTWRRRRDAARGEFVSADAPLHAEADIAERYRSRDELRYALRSLESFAPWIRNVYVVTDGQRPSWLDTASPRIRLVDHREIFPADWLPVFNSHAISSRVHHIDGLSEHYLLVNDDVLFGRWSQPEDYFTPAGQPRFFRSSVRLEPGDPLATDLPHVGAQKRSARLLERDLGRRVTRAYYHVPHPQRRSLHLELERRYPEVYESTGRSRFRAATDHAIASVLHHGYGEITGQAVAGTLRYAYVNPALAAHRATLTRLLRLRDRDAFCLNDSPAPGSDDLGAPALARFLPAFLPVRSTFELTPERSAVDGQ
jgi:glycosyltransferase involved in cell wall biosynthesis